MNFSKMSGRRLPLLLATLLAGTGVLGAADATSQNEEIARLRAALAEQQKQLQMLQQSLERTQQQIEAAAQRPNLGNVASLTPVIPAPATPAAIASPFPQAAPAAKPPANPCEADNGNAVPAFLRLGGVCITPVGFLDLTPLWRDKNAGSSLGSNFGSVPYNNSINAKNSEFRFTPQNSRLGLRVDGSFMGTRFTGYNEFDFLGTGAGTNYTVTNGAFVPRLRLFWVNLKKGKMEFLAGQSWTMLTPNRNGISALPGDLFYSQVIDVNYMAGLTWTRQPGIRILYHPNKDVTFGLSFENPDQYVGGSAGGSSITYPTAFAAASTAIGTTGTYQNSQLDGSPNISVANTVLAVPTVHPDIIAKVAYQPNSHAHVEIAGLYRTFKVYNPTTATHYTAPGAGISVNGNFELVKNFRLVTNNYWSDGGGRYLFGQAPDVVVRSDGSLSAVHSGGVVEGFEETYKNTLLYAYYGGIYIGRNTGLDADGKTPIGYGFTKSSNGQNRAIQELTFGFNQTMWRSPRYGAFNIMGQYEYLLRNPWYYAAGQAGGKGTHDNTIYVNIRYTLPGGAPNF